MLKRIEMIAIYSAALLVAGAFSAGDASGLSLFNSRNLERWLPEEFAAIMSLRLNQLPAAPADPSNAVENSAAAIELGRRLFADARLSSNSMVSCASCHDPAKQFQDDRPVGQGVGTGGRRSMPIVGLGHSPWLFWDGRKDSAWSQAVGPLEDAVEHGGNRMAYAHQIAAHYRSEYVALFGPLPDLGSLPANASPAGTAVEQIAWQSMDATSRDNVSRIYANMGKAIAAFEKTLRHSPSRLDRYLDAVSKGNSTPQTILSPQEINGLRLFVGKGQCISCHNGPLLTDQQFHNTGVPPRDSMKPDRGRAAAVPKVLQDEFNCLGRYSDAKPEQCNELRFIATNDPHMEGAFKTPGLRGVSLRPPYMHAGQIATLEDVVRHYVNAPHAALGHSELSHLHPEKKPTGKEHLERQPIVLSEAEQRDLVSFLGTLH
ncbi:MAG: cytochrome-c peroxidase [Betaproteobacteria bacterium]|nr:cytochrome-c peroxidase [Betaproteobacteria bacterium]